jgi:hypothetical protein
LHADKDRDDEEIDAGKDRAADVSGQGRPTHMARPLALNFGVRARPTFQILNLPAFCYAS